MPVNGRFRLRRESRRAFLRSRVGFTVAKSLLAGKSIATQLFLLAIVASIFCLTCSTNFYIARLRMLSTPPPPAVH